MEYKLKSFKIQLFYYKQSCDQWIFVSVTRGSWCAATLSPPAKVMDQQRRLIIFWPWCFYVSVLENYCICVYDLLNFIVLNFSDGIQGRNIGVVESSVNRNNWIDFQHYQT